MQSPTPAMRFNARKGTFFKAFLIVFFLLGIAVIVTGLRKENGLATYDWIWIGIWLTYIGMHCHRWLNTYYELQDDALVYRSGFSKGIILIESIRKIKPRQKGIGDFRAALSGLGMELIYNKFDDLFIAPQEPEKLVAELLKRNPAIELQISDTKAGAA